MTFIPQLVFFVHSGRNDLYCLPILPAPKGGLLFLRHDGRVGQDYLRLPNFLVSEKKRIQTFVETWFFEVLVKQGGF